MDFKFSKETAESASPASADKGRQNFLLIVLLILVAVFGYIYFFTDLIKPQETQKPAEAPAPQVVKKPLPPREGQDAKTGTAAAPEVKKEATTTAKTEPQKVAVAETPAAKTPPPAKQEPGKPSKPAPATDASKIPAVPDEKGQKQMPSKAAEKKPVVAEKPQPIAAGKKVSPAPGGDKKPAEAGKIAGSDKKTAAVTAPKKVAVKPKKIVASVSAQEGDGGPWTIVVGSYVLEEALSKDLGRVRKAGLEASVQHGGRKKAHMNRLLLGEYADRVAAQTELDKLKRSTSDAFILNQGGKHCVYAGSYLLQERAVSEKERLAAAGFNLTLKHADVTIPSENLTAGTFSSRKSAEAALKKLKDTGIKATLSRQ
jgi:cell division septation protein DedD